MRLQFSEEENILTIRLPVHFKRRSGRKMIIAPRGMLALPHEKDLRASKPDQSFVNALVKAFQWQELIDQGVCASPKDVAKRENAEVTHVYRLMRLTMLAPDIVEAILDGKQPRTLTLQNVVRGFPISWREQRAQFGFNELT